MKRIIKKVRKGVKALPERKIYIDLIAGVLGIPALIMVLILNYNNLQLNKKPTQITTNNQRPIIIQTSPATGIDNTVKTTPVVCKKEIGPISISDPKENETVDDNPLTITIKYDNENYCSVVWSYRINGGKWSEYSSNSISLYNMSSGDKKLELRVQSTVSSDTTTLTRNFKYKNTDSGTATTSAR